MKRIVLRAAIVLVVAAAGLCGALGGACAQDWVLNSGVSHFYMQTAKADSIVETGQFTKLDGTISKDGDAKIVLDLSSVASGIDVRDTRMRFLLFETYKFPNAEITAKVDMAKLQELQTVTRITYPLKFTLAMHGMAKDFEAPVFVTRLSPGSVAVVTAKPIVVTAESFGMTEGIAKLSAAVNGTPIVSAASITFDLVFDAKK